MNAPVRRSMTRGFSLLEIMVAVSLLAVIIVGLLAMFYQVQRAFRAGTAQVDVMEGGRAAVKVVAGEIQEAVASGRFNTLNLLTYPGYSASHPASYQDLPSGALRTNWIQDVFFLSRRNDEVYGTAYRVDTVGGAAGALVRLTTNSAVTNLVSIADNVTNWLSVLNTAVPAPDFHRVVDGVVHFRILPYDTNGFLMTTNYLRDINSPEGMLAGHAFPGDALPAWVDIELGVLEPSTFEKYKARTDPDPQKGIDYLEKQIGRVHLFRQRIAIRPAATDIGEGLRASIP